MSKILLESRVNPLSLSRIAKVQCSAKSAYLGQCFQLVLIKDICTVCATKICPQIYTESCDQSYSIGIKISKQRGDLAMKTSCV